MTSANDMMEEIRSLHREIRAMDDKMKRNGALLYTAQEELIGLRRSREVLMDTVVALNQELDSYKEIALLFETVVNAADMELTQAFRHHLKVLKQAYDQKISEESEK